MARKCDIEISVWDKKLNEWGDRRSLVEFYDFHLLKSDPRITAPIRDYEVQEYPETSEAEIDNRTTLKPFDYKMTIGCWGNEETINKRIREFFDSFFEKYPDSDVMDAKRVMLYNNYKNVKMEGYLKPWNEKTYTLENENGLVVFDMEIFVDKPKTLTCIC